MKKIISVAFAMVMVLVISVAWASVDTKGKEKELFDGARKEIVKENIKSVEDLHETLKSKGPVETVVLDIRTKAEFDQGHIEGSNNLDPGHFYKIPVLWPNADTELWIVCRSGKRATYFVNMLNRLGYSNVFLVDKGLVAWAGKGYPLVNKYLGSIKVIKYEDQVKEHFVYREDL